MSHRFITWDPSLISPLQNENKSRNANFGFHVKHSRDWRRHARWQKRHCEMRAAYDAFCHSEEDTSFRARTWGDRKDLLPERTKCRTDIACSPQKPWIAAKPCTVKSVQDLINKFVEIGCTCDRPRSGWPAVPVETVAEVHQTVSTVCPATTCGVSRVLNLPNSTVRKILRSVLNMFPFRFQRVQMLEGGQNQLRLDFANKFLIRYDEDSSWPLRILWTDKAHLTLIGNMN